MGRYLELAKGTLDGGYASANKANKANKAPLNSHSSLNSHSQIPNSGPAELEQALHEACRHHDVNADQARWELYEAGDWPDHVTPDNVHAFVAAYARPQGTFKELRDAIHRWARVAGLSDAQRQQLLDGVCNVPPALISAEIEYFQRRIKQQEQAEDEGWVLCNPAHYVLPDQTDEWS